MGIKSNTEVRTLQRGMTHRLECSFFQDDAMTIPLVSYDLTQWPSFSIFDVTNNIVSTGVGQQLSPGNYQCLWNIPADATLSNDDRRYRIEWYFKDENGAQFSFSQEIDVVDTEIPASENPEQVYYTLKNKKYRLRFKTKVRPHELTLEMFKGTNEENPILKDLTLSGNDIQGPIENEIWKTWYYDIEEGILDTACNYTVIWGVQEYEISDFSYETQTIHVLPASLMQFIRPLRMLIDKLQKKLNKIQAYQDSDCIEYLYRGLEMVNLIPPATYYSVQQLPQQLQVAWMIASGWYALTAQNLLEVELSYNFGGQSDTFEYDHASGIADVLGRFREYLDGPVANAKTQLFRTSHRIGAVGTRFQSYRRGYGQNLVFPLKGGGGLTGGPTLGNYIAFFSLS